MLLGLITDLHEEPELAQAVILAMRQKGIDCIVFLGDFCSMGQRLNETCEVLFREGVECVWGNHDFGLCEDARNGVLTEYAQVVTQFAAKAHANLKIGDMHFSHVEPWLDPDELSDLWYYDGLPDNDEKRARLFAANHWRLAFGGHYHCWFAVRETGSVEWDGTQPLDLSEGRWFVVIDTCMNGSFAILDTDRSLLTPLRIVI